MSEQGLLEHVDVLRVALEEKTRQRDRYRDALMNVACASSLAEAVRIARDAFRDAGEVPVRGRGRSRVVRV